MNQVHLTLKIKTKIMDTLKENSELTEDDKLELLNNVAYLADKKGFIGVDISPEIALYEYHFLYHEETNEVLATNFVHLYDHNTIPLDDIYFITTYYDEDIIQELFEDYKEGILSCVGMNEDEWQNLHPVSKLSDINSYMGIIFEDVSYSYGWNRYSIDEITNYLKSNY